MQGWGEAHLRRLGRPQPLGMARPRFVVLHPLDRLEQTIYRVKGSIPRQSRGARQLKIVADRNE
jgi:hypothetical protein